mmetsp:Transcript_28886/g.47910  ORF Transcript_28886/g.47910 Transcript_28886/m.47910 type:complete len:129 (-) Transcript_28886:173-559(-)
MSDSVKVGADCTLTLHVSCEQPCMCIRTCHEHVHLFQGYLQMQTRCMWHELAHLFWSYTARLVQEKGRRPSMYAWPTVAQQQRWRSFLRGLFAPVSKILCVICGPTRWYTVHFGAASTAALLYDRPSV